MSNKSEALKLADVVDVFDAQNERLPHNLNSTVFVYRHRETGAIRALYTEDARAMTGRDDYEHVASLEPRMWIEHHFDGKR